MDISALTISMQPQNVSNDIGIAMLSKSLDTMSDMGDGLKKMMESSVTPDIGQNIDILI
jgi:hypothetical protein